MKINRLLEITIILLNRKSVTAKELADRFSVSTRTIYRDLDVLSTAGVPVYTSKGNGGGISLLENYALNRTLLSEQESESLVFALKTLQATKYPEIDMVLDKIGGLFKNTDVSDWVDIDLSPWGSQPNEYNKFANIKQAILKRQVISFCYINSNGERSVRSMEPMRLVYKGQAWYLWGYCRVKNDFRVFRISRIKDLRLCQETFLRRKLDPPVIDDANTKAPYSMQLRLKFHPEVIHRVYDDFDDAMIEKKEDGSCELKVEFPMDAWVYGFILSFGEHVEVLEPEHIRLKIQSKLKKALENYQN
jgi:predicted DNA-binding transcriptional regulator YafY